MQRTSVTQNNNNIIYFMHFIFVVAQAYENILTTKISQFTVTRNATVLGERRRVLHMWFYVSHNLNESVMFVW